MSAILGYYQKQLTRKGNKLLERNKRVIEQKCLKGQAINNYCEFHPSSSHMRA